MPDLLHDQPMVLHFPLYLLSNLFSTLQLSPSYHKVNLIVISCNNFLRSQVKDKTLPWPTKFSRTLPLTAAHPPSLLFITSWVSAPLAFFRTLNSSCFLLTQGLCTGCCWKALLFILHLGDYHSVLHNHFQNQFLHFLSQATTL